MMQCSNWEQSAMACLPRMYPKMATMRSLVQSVGFWTTVSARMSSIPTSLKQLEANKKATPSHSTTSPNTGWGLAALHKSSMLFPFDMRARTSTWSLRFLFQFKMMGTVLISSSLESICGLSKSKTLATQSSCLASCSYFSMGLTAKRQTRTQARTMNLILIILWYKFQLKFHLNRLFTKNNKRNKIGPQNSPKSLCFYPPYYLHPFKLIIISYTIKQQRITYHPFQYIYSACICLLFSLFWRALIPIFLYSQILLILQIIQQMNQRASHFQFGTVSQNYGSVYAKDFGPKKTTGVSLGDKAYPMETINQQYYNKKQLSKNTLPESTIKELKNTHFNLGLMPQQYDRQSDNYKSTSAANQKQSNTKTFYQSGTWVDKNAKFNPSTTHKRQLPPRQVKPFERAVQITKSGIDLGGFSGNYTSQNKNSFQYDASKLVRNNINVDKTGNIVIGIDKGYYSTQNKSSYRQNDLLGGRVIVDIARLSKEDHFHIGGTGVEAKVTVYQDEHRRDINNRNKLFHKENK